MLSGTWLYILLCLNINIAVHVLEPMASNIVCPNAHPLQITESLQSEVLQLSWKESSFSPSCQRARQLHALIAR